MAFWSAVGDFARSAVGDFASSAIGYLGGRRQERQNLDISRRQMDFQREMSSTAYQRSMADMRSAGLNPILAYKQGGASTPSGAGIPAVNPTATALSANLMKAQTRQSLASGDLQSMQKFLVKMQADTEEQKMFSAKAKANIDRINSGAYVHATGTELGDVLLKSKQFMQLGKPVQDALLRVFGIGVGGRAVKGITKGMKR